VSARANRTGVYELPEVPELEDIFKVWARRIKLSIRTNTVGKVIVYDPATQKATVSVEILQIVKVFNIPTDPNAVAPSPPAILTNIPVVWPRGSTGYMTTPLLPGATGEIRIQDRSLHQWMLLGAATDPVLAFTHALQDGVFEPGLHADINPITPPTDQTATVLHDDLAIKLGRAAALGVARQTDTVTQGPDMTAFMAATVTALNTIAAAVPVAIVPPIPPGTLGTITTASTKVKAE